MDTPNDPRIPVPIQEELEHFRRRMEAQLETYQSAATLLEAVGLLRDMEALHESHNSSGPRSAAEHLGHLLHKWLHLPAPTAKHSAGTTGNTIDGVILSRSGLANSADNANYRPIIIVTATTADGDDLPREGR